MMRPTDQPDGHTGGFTDGLTDERTAEILPGLDLHRFRSSGRPAAEDPRGARMIAAVERGFYEAVPTGAALDQVLDLDAQDQRTYVGVYEAGASPETTEPVGTFAAFSKYLQTGTGREIEGFLISDVTVRSTHRRRGILRAMMRAELDRAAAAGIPVAALSASEATIYRRFGFGVATTRRTVEVDTGGDVALAGPVSGSMRMVEPKDLRDLGPVLYDSAHRQSPGAVGRTAAYSVIETDTWMSKNDGKGTGVLAAVHHDDGGTPRGYVTYTFTGWDQKVPTVKIGVLVASTAASYRAIWDYLVHLDLIQKVEWGFASDDRLLENLLVDPRRVKTTGHADQLWLRLLDVPACLKGRPYHRDGELILEVTDPLGYAAGVWRLTVEGGTADVVKVAVRVGDAEAEPQTVTADLTLEVADLSSVYLGGVSAEVLRQAGRIAEHRPGAAVELTALLAQDRPVFCMTGF
ncbi:GNAT family N-acetyltransferase [Citricoccus muralis]|uniref:Putative acetyltransferase n=1 Tax=Citricoccus muralis TaxID=169134 RepID=A0A3D9LAZ5_9MICC|nr:GNAT family N-acetyltransferase [Citricoccus muralis]REE03020.1 putative acetyltransferase [Citricoccus muralis]